MNCLFSFLCSALLFVPVCNAQAGNGTSSSVFTMSQTTSDGSQWTMLAFAGLAMTTWNKTSQSFFPPGKVADYTCFQYLHDNDPDNMGHNTSFLTVPISWSAGSRFSDIVGADQNATLTVPITETKCFFCLRAWQQ